MEQLKAMETAFDKLTEQSVWNSSNDTFKKDQDRLRFQARKQEYKRIRDEAWRWLRNHDVRPKKRQDYDKGFYGVDGLYQHATIHDNPFRWWAQAKELREELEAAVESLRTTRNQFMVNV